MLYSWFNSNRFTVSVFWIILVSHGSWSVNRSAQSLQSRWGISPEWDICFLHVILQWFCQMHRVLGTSSPLLSLRSVVIWTFKSRLCLGNYKWSFAWWKWVLVKALGPRESFQEIETTGLHRILSQVIWAEGFGLGKYFWKHSLKWLNLYKKILQI